MNVSLVLPDYVAQWASKQIDPETAIIQALVQHVEANDTPIGRAWRVMQQRIPTLPKDTTYISRQLVGDDEWDKLTTSDAVKLGLKIRKAVDQLGLICVSQPNKTGKYRVVSEDAPVANHVRHADDSASLN